MSPTPLRIAVVSKANAAGGGASRVAEDLGHLLNQEPNVACHHWLARSDEPLFEHMRRIEEGAWFQPAHAVVRHLSARVGLPDFVSLESMKLAPRRPEYDVYHFHDISSAISPLTVWRLAKKRPVVWTFHDCSPFTGGCLHPSDCTAFHSRCRRCPQLGRWPLRTKVDLTGWMHAFKRRMARSGLVVPIAPSDWVAGEAMKSGMFRERPRVIPNSVDLDLFRPQHRPTLREHLGLAKDAFTVLLTAMSLGDPYKGVPDAVAALRALGGDATALLVGRRAARLVRELGDLRTVAVGSVRDARMMGLYCAVADVLVYPSKNDNLPNSVLEAMASGTPTIAYETGGIPELVTHDENGWLAPRSDVAGLVEGLRRARADSDRWGRAGRRRAEQRHGRRAFVDAHLALYRALISQRRADE